MNDEVVCLLCGRSFRTQGSHLNHAHGIGVFDYRRQFPGAQTTSAETSEAQSAAAVERWKDPEYARCVIEGNRGKVMSEEAKQNMALIV